MAAGAALAAAVFSCAYYNIMWTANKEYGKATRGLAFTEFWDPYEQENLTGESLKLVNSAASRCGKVLVLYPDSKWADDALLLMGKCFLLSKDYDKALKKFREIGALYSEGELAEESRYLEAYTLILQGSPDLAVSQLQSLARQAEGKSIREKTRYLIARVEQERGDCLAAVGSFAAYLEEYPEGERSEEVRLALGDCRLRLGLYREAIEVLEPLTGELDEEGVLALLRVGRAYRMLGETGPATEAFDDVLEGAGEDTLRARAGIEEALTHLDEGRPEDAIGDLVLADSLGNLKLSGEINYQIGLIYERELGDFEQAVLYYDESVKKKSPYSRLAAKRSTALKNVKQYQEAIASGEGDVARSRYLLAETYLYDLGMTESAIGELAAVADSFPESEYAARSMLAVAAYLEDGGDTLAVDYYERVIEGFPETAYANVARQALGLPPVDVKVEEPAAEPTAGEAGGEGLTAGGETAGALEGEPGRAPGSRRPSRAPVGPPAPGDTLAGADSAATQEPTMPGIEMLPGLSDSARARYDAYRGFTEPEPDLPGAPRSPDEPGGTAEGRDTAAVDTSGFDEEPEDEP